MPLAVGQSAVIEKLEQDIENIGVSFFYFIEQNHGKRFSSDSFGQLAALFVTDVAGRRSDKTADGMRFHVFAHVDADHRILVIEKVFGKRARKLGFADACRAEENKRADRFFFIAHPRARTFDSVADSLNRLVLADHPLVKLLADVQQLFPLRLHHFADRYSSPSGNNVGDISGVDLFFRQQLARSLFFFYFLLVCLDLFFNPGNAAVPYFRNLSVIAAPLILFSLVPQVFQFRFQFSGFLNELFLGIPARLDSPLFFMKVGKLFFDIL